MRTLVVMLLIVAFARAEVVLEPVPPKPPATQTADGQPLRMIFVCDASAAAKDVYPLLAREFDKGLDGLTPVQSFNVIMTAEKVPAAFERLTVASPDHRKRAKEFVHAVKIGGEGDARAALERAMSDNVQMIYFATVATVDEATAEQIVNKRKEGVSINVIWLTDKHEESRGLRRIAQGTGGKYLVVQPADLGEPPTTQP